MGFSAIVFKQRLAMLCNNQQNKIFFEPVFFLLSRLLIEGQKVRKPKGLNNKYEKTGEKTYEEL